MRALVVVLLCACSDDGQNTCVGPGDAGSSGVTATAGADVATYGNFEWGANNDCPASGSSVVSVTIIGEQVGISETAGMALCLPRPDLIEGTVSLTDTTRVRLDSLTAQVGECRFTKSGDPSGTVTFGGFCNEAGSSFSLRFDGAVPATRECDGGTSDTVTLSLAGAAAVTPRP